MNLAELPAPSRAWLAALAFPLLLIPRGQEQRSVPVVPVVVQPTTPVRAEPSPCDDPYVGVWVARSHRDEHGDWHEYKLEIRRDRDQLLGALALRAWPGDELSVDAPQCADGTSMVTHDDDIPVEITLHGSQIRLDAGHARTHRNATCNSVGDYSPDHFRGAIHVRDGYMDVVNSDDAGNAHERPYQFVRMACVP